MGIGKWWVIGCAVCLSVGALRADEATKADETSPSAAVQRLLNARAAGNPRAYIKAAKKVSESAEAGDELSKFVLALVAKEFNTPEEVRLDETSAKDYLRTSFSKVKAMADEKADPLAMYLMSIRSNDRALLKRAADAGNLQAMNAWASMSLTEALRNPYIKPEDLKRVEEECCAYFQRAADANDANGYYNLGMCRLQGYGCPTNTHQAYECFRSAAVQAHPEAVNNIGGFYRDGIVVKKDISLATKWFAKSAAMGNAYGQLNYALALQRGEGIEKDEKMAAELFRKAAEQGNAEAMNAYGLCFYSGSGLDRDEQSAIYWYRRAAALGYAPAMDNLASCYEHGIGVEKNSRLSVEWLVRGRAARGDRNARIWLKEQGLSEK